MAIFGIALELIPGSEKNYTLLYSMNTNITDDYDMHHISTYE